MKMYALNWLCVHFQENDIINILLQIESYIMVSKKCRYVLIDAVAAILVNRMKELLELSEVHCAFTCTHTHEQITT